MATIHAKKIATTGSEHFSPGASLGMSLIPPVPPAGPATAPFAYISMSKSATDTSSLLKIQGHPVLVSGSMMTIERPGNLPGQPTGGDIITRVACSASRVFTGSFTVLAGGQKIACTGDSVRMNVPAANGYISQVIGTLITMEEVRKAKSMTAISATSHALLDPISAVSGAVVDTDEILSLPGMIPLRWKRYYDSQRNEKTSLGRGGWIHSLDQWIEIDGDTLRFRDENGSTLTKHEIKRDQPLFLRAQRLEITLDSRGGARVYSLDTHEQRIYRSQGGTRAWLVEIANTTGQSIRLEYEGESLARIVDTAGRTIELERNQQGFITRISVYPASGARNVLLSLAFAYDDDDALVCVTDPRGYCMRYIYGERTRMIQKTLPTGLSFYYIYDPDTGRCIRSFGDGGLHAGDISYDEAEGITRLTGNPEPRVITYRPQDGAITSIMTPDGSAALKCEYDDDMRLLSQNNAAGHGPKCEHDERGNLIRIIDPQGRVSERTYENDLLVRRVVEGQTTEYSYNARKQLQRITFPGGSFLEMAYDEKGRPITIFDPAGLRSRFVWDEQHNCIEEQIRQGMIRRWTFDDLGRIVGFIDQQGQQASRRLDAAGNVLSHQNPDGTRIEFEYDALGRRIKCTNEHGRTRTIRYAGLKSATEMTYEDGSVWRIDYDQNERAQRIENPKCERYELRYDRLGSVKELRTFDGRILRASYGKNGMVSRLALADGTFRAIKYDETDLPIEENTPHGKATAVRDYKERKATFTLEDPAGTFRAEMHWDELGRIISDKQPAGEARFEYDSLDRCTAILLPSGKAIRYTYNDAGLVATVSHEGETVRMGYDSAGNFTAYRFESSGVEVRLVENERGAVVRQWIGKDGITLNDRAHTWDAVGHLLATRDMRWGETTYEHDEIGQLLSARSSHQKEQFEYDGAGSVIPKGERWDIAPGNVVRKTTTHEYGYDEQNRRILKKDLKTGKKTQYFWDCRNNLREVVREDGSRVLLTYDIFGRRIQKEIIPALPPFTEEKAPVLPKSTIIQYLWNGDLLLAEMSEQGERTVVYHPGTLIPLLQGEKDGVLGVITNYLGQATDLLDAKGNLVFSGHYAAWGSYARVAGDGGKTPMLRSQGFFADEDLGLFYVRHRYFDAELMRFLSADPLGFEGGMNLFAFNGSPVSSIDPLGLACLLLGNPRVDPALDYIYRYPRNSPGQYRVYVHGTETNVSVKDGYGEWQHHGPDWLMQRIKDANNYHHNEVLVLNSCNTGRSPVGFAQQLAARHGVGVFAPNEMVWGHGDAIAPPIGVPDSRHFLPKGNETADPSRPGQWNYWYPGGFPHPQNQRPAHDLPPPGPTS